MYKSRNYVSSAINGSVREEPIRKYKKKAKYYARPDLYRLKKEVSMLKARTKEETKYHEDISNIGMPTNIGNTIIVQNCMNQIAQGTDENQRIGNTIYIKRITVRGIVKANSAMTAVCDVVRFIIWVDTKNLGANPGTGTLLENTNPYSGINSDSSERFWVLHSELFHVDKVMSTGHEINTSIKCGFQARYTSNAADSFSTNAVYYGFLSDSAANNPQFILEWRVSYTDC